MAEPPIAAARNMVSCDPGCDDNINFLAGPFPVLS
jgi:hypothetical protein